MSNQVPGQMAGQMAPGNGQNLGNGHAPQGNRFVSGPQGILAMQGQMGQGNGQNFGNGQNYNQGHGQMGQGQGQGHGQGYGSGPQQGNGNFNRGVGRLRDFHMVLIILPLMMTSIEPTCLINMAAVVAASNMGSDDDYFDNVYLLVQMVAAHARGYGRDV